VSSVEAVVVAALDGPAKELTDVAAVVAGMDFV